jgi:hypothetical protein
MFMTSAETTTAVFCDLAACRREKAIAHYKALRFVRRSTMCLENPLSAFGSVLVREAFLPVGTLRAIAYALPRPS